MLKNIILAGFGGQGVLFAGKVLAYAGLCDDKNVSWLPSYGPEMRGGTANCSVVVSDKPIGSPLVLNPDLLVVMNQPYYDKFIDSVVSGGVVVYDSSLIEAKNLRNDVTMLKVDATELAEKNGLSGLSNMILIGRAIKETPFVSDEGVDKGLQKSIPPKKANLLDSNRKAIELGKSL
ncbi:MAG: 2-oxoacid:ferredoxin oxidoreductase subunit gamma [Ruminococcaceae bacterium]|nr:2-oxoacid:ferredoxin oxidoreductase subunit gamma [Oscillospiraceae bacterium]